MRIEDIIVEDEYLEEGPIWDKTRQVGAAVGKGLGAVGQGIGAVAGVPAGIARAIGKGYNRSANTIAGGPDENPQQGSAQYQPAGQQQSAAGQTQAAAGQGAEDPATMRKQARDLMARADEIERQQKQTSQSAPSQQTTQPNQNTGNATSDQQASQAQPNQTQQAPGEAPPAQKIPMFNKHTGEKFASQDDAKAFMNSPEYNMSTDEYEKAQAAKNQQASLPAPTQQAPAAPADNVSTTSSTGGSYNNQIGNGKANYGVTTNFDPNTMKNVSTPLNPKAVGVVPNTTNPTTNNTNQNATNKRPPASTDMAARRAALAQSKADRDAGGGVTGAMKKFKSVATNEDIQYYSRFLKIMI